MTEDFESTIKRLCAMMLQQAIGEANGHEWLHAFLDARYDESGSFIHKLRLQLKSGALISLSEASEIILELITLRSLRHSLGTTWFGIHVIVHFDQRCEVNLNYDSSCPADPTFFDT